MATFANLTTTTLYDVTGPDGQFISRNLTGAQINSPAPSCDAEGNIVISANHWPAGSCAWLTQCPDGADDTEPADVAV